MSITFTHCLWNFHPSYIFINSIFCVFASLACILIRKDDEYEKTQCTKTLIINQNHISSNSSLIIVLSSNTCSTNMNISDSWSVSDSWLLSSDTWSRNYINSQNLINNLKLSPSAWLSITGSHLQVFPPILISIINHNCSTSTCNLDKWLQWKQPEIWLHHTVMIMSHQRYSIHMQQHCWLYML